MQFVGTMPAMIEIAGLLSAVLGSWLDFWIIFALLMTNATLGFVEEMNAQASISALKDGMIRKLPVKRDGKFTPMDVAEIVPCDVVFLRGGNVIPADGKWLDGDRSFYQSTRYRIALQRRLGLYLSDFVDVWLSEPQPPLAALADLGIKRVEYLVVDKDYAEWLKKAEQHPLPSSPLPHAIEWDAVWADWTKRTARTHRCPAATRGGDLYPLYPLYVTRCRAPCSDVHARCRVRTSPPLGQVSRRWLARTRSMSRPMSTSTAMANRRSSCSRRRSNRQIDG